MFDEFDDYDSYCESEEAFEDELEDLYLERKERERKAKKAAIKTSQKGGCGCILGLLLPIFISTITLILILFF